MRAARLERDMQDCIGGGPAAQRAESHHLSVRLADLGMKTFGHDDPTLGDYRPDHRVRVRATPRLSGELQRSAHRGLGRGRRHDQRLRLRETAAALALPGVS